ncbi:hypothetical protein ACH4UT_25160 [Streptomyces sp. NPDC020799]|uniref:hypothetical protein n=1 Tax=Streptomyces sp. NPDC020799 TaxID=3365091 RepID=UPI0037B38185
MHNTTRPAIAHASGPSVTVTGDPRTCPECTRLKAVRAQAQTRGDKAAEASATGEARRHLHAAHGPGCFTCAKLLLARVTARRTGDLAGGLALDEELNRHRQAAHAAER